LLLKFLAVQTLGGTIGMTELHKYRPLAVESCLVGDGTADPAGGRTRSLAAWPVGVLGLETGDGELLELLEQTVSETCQAYLSGGPVTDPGSSRPSLQVHALHDVLSIYYFALQTEPVEFEPGNLDGVEDNDIVKAAIDTLTGDDGDETKRLFKEIRNDFDRPMEIRLHTARALKDLVMAERRADSMPPGDIS
jgi:hypothetical protein